MLSLPISVAGWAFAASSLLTISAQIQQLINPNGFMREFGVGSADVTRLVGTCLLSLHYANDEEEGLLHPANLRFLHTAFLLIILNTYDLVSVATNNVLMLWVSIACRTGAFGLFYYLGGKWRGLAKLEGGVVCVLAALLALFK